MKLRNTVAALTAGGVALTVASIAPASATTHRPFVAYAQTLSLKMAVPGTLGANGSFVISLTETGTGPDNYGFDLYRNTAENGNQYVGRYYNTTTTTDLEQLAYGTTTYEAIPFDRNYNQGDPVYSITDTPTTVDNPFSVTAGAGSVVSNSKYYGGSALETTSVGANASWSTGKGYNFGIVVGTGPKGGVGTVYVDGKKQPGTINFYSKSAVGKLVDFKYGTSGANPAVSHTIKVVETAAGTGKGTQMYFDAGTELASS